MSTGISTITGYHNRRSIRLKGFDYSTPGFYFITICIHDPTQSLFGEIINGEMVLNKFGIIVRDEWIKTPLKRDNSKIDEYIIMPNHIHGIIQICGNTPVGAYCHTPTQNKTDGVDDDTPLQKTDGVDGDMTLQPGGAYVDTPLQKNGGVDGDMTLQPGGAYDETPLQKTDGVDGDTPIQKIGRAYINTPLHEKQNQQLKSPSNTVGSIIRGFKGVVKIAINNERTTLGKAVWQRNYYDHIVRDDRSFFRIRQYIRNNPHQWSLKSSEQHLYDEVEAFNNDESWLSHYIDYPS
jgi:REP element-mobilizing transposase RayT